MDNRTRENLERRENFGPLLYIRYENGFYMIESRPKDITTIYGSSNNILGACKMCIDGGFVPIVDDDARKRVK